MTVSTFKIAQITAAHGIRGEVKLRCFLENPSDITRYTPLTNKAGKLFTPTITGQQQETLIVRFAHVADRNAAELLRGVELYAPLAQLPAKKDDEFFGAELVGLKAILEDGSIYGTVIAMHNFGAGDIIEIQTMDDAVMLPFKAPFVGKITGGKIEITLPDYIESEPRD